MLVKIKNLIKHTVVLFISLTAIVSSQGQPVLPQDELAERLAAVETAHQKLDTVFTVTTLKNIKVTDYEQGERWTEEDWVDRLLWRLRIENALYRVDQFDLFQKDVPLPDELSRPDRIHLWNGSNWIEQAVYENEIIYSKQPKFDYTTDSLGWFNANAHPTFGGGYVPFSHAVKTLQLLSSGELENGMAEYEFLIGEEPLTRMKLVVDLKQTVRVMSVEMELFSNKDSTYSGRLLRRVRYHVDSWYENDGLLLPGRACRDLFTYESSSLSARGVEMPASRTVFERVSAKIPDDTESNGSVFYIVPDHETAITDQCLNVNYKINSNNYFVDGIEYISELPVSNGLSRELGISSELASSVEVQPTAISGPVGVNDKSESALKFALILGVAGFVVTILLWLSAEKVLRRKLA